MIEIEARNLAFGQPDHCGERSVLRLRHASGFADLFAKHARAKRRWIGVANHRTGLHHLARFQSHARDAAATGLNFLDLRAVAETRAVPARDRFKRVRQSVHSALDLPHTLRLDMGDQH